MEITKEQVLELKSTIHKERVDYLLKEWFPEAFRTELEIGKWYKSVLGGLWCISKESTNDYQWSFGINIYGDWQSEARRSSIDLTPATEAEADAALIAEAKKRGFKKGYKPVPHNIYAYKITDSDFYFDFNNNQLFVRQKNDTFAKIFDNGIWAEILPEKKTVISKEKALKIVAKKLKISPENLEIK